MVDKGYQCVVIIVFNYLVGKDVLVGFKCFFKKDFVVEFFFKLGQLDFVIEIVQLCVVNIDVLYFFLLGGMGVNFVK